MQNFMDLFWNRLNSLFPQLLLSEKTGTMLIIVLFEDITGIRGKEGEK